MKTNAKYVVSHTLLLLATAGFCSVPLAATTDIADSPMASSGNTSVKPNIMFILDDSGSMDWEYLPDYVNSNNGKYCYRNSYYNGVYYNPDITYEVPVNADSTSFPDSDFFAAKVSGFSGTTTK